MDKNYDLFLKRLELLFVSRIDLTKNTLSNIFAMRKIGNKTHGDLAEIAITEHINQFMYDYSCKHVGKEKFRSKQHEEDIEVKDKISGDTFSISLKAYGEGPLQLSTDSNNTIFSFLEKKHVSDITNKEEIEKIVNDQTFQSCCNVNVISLIYNEKNSKCNIMVFDILKALNSTSRIIKLDQGEKFCPKSEKIIKQGSRKHPIFVFLDANSKYIFEIRYGDSKANALQRGIWTNTKNANSYFKTLCKEWIHYESREDLIRLIQLSLICTTQGHQQSITILQNDINNLFASNVKA